MICAANKSAIQLNHVLLFTTDYTFTGNPHTVEHTHTASGKATITEKYAYTYDQIDRLTKVEHQLGNNPVVTLAENTYDALGRLQTKQQHGSQWLTSTYTYNIRNWLTRIRSYHFYQDLYYTENHHGNTPLYNGNISSMQWRMNGITRGYNYSYDQLNRLTDAVYGENDDFDAGIGFFSVNGCRYDKNGNLLTMMRYGKIWNDQHDLIDDLSLSYNGNQLKTANDAVTKPPLLHDSFEFFENDNHEKTEYWYDSAGSLTADLNKGISFIYNNSLYLPYFVQFSNGNCLTNEYSVDGMKRRVTHYTAIPNIFVPMRQFRELKNDEIQHRTTTDYCGNIIYEDGNLKMILTEEGFITMENGAPLYHYYVKDYQGNNRMVIKADDHMDGRAEQYNHYYPFGGVFETDNNSSPQPYKYNGKELDRMFGLNWYDYSARTMDPLLGRFNSIDPLAEKYPNVSPYVYCNNNPIRYIDPSGQDGMVTGSGTKEDPYVITATYIYQNGTLDSNQLEGLKSAITSYNNSGKDGLTEIKNSDGTKSYVRYELSAQGVDDVAAIVRGGTMLDLIILQLPKLAHGNGDVRNGGIMGNSSFHTINRVFVRKAVAIRELYKVGQI
jgi:RHS repeat-associated protein